MVGETQDPGLHLVALVGAGEAEVPVLAELHRNPRVHLVGVYDPDPLAVGLDLAEILGLRHGTEEDFLEHLASAEIVVLPRDRHRFEDPLRRLEEAGCRLLSADEALRELTPEARVSSVRRASPFPRPDLETLEKSVHWIQKALDREELLRSLLSIAVQAAGASQGSIQLLDAYTQELYIAYAQGLSEHTVRSSRQSLGEGIAGEVASRCEARLIQGRREMRSERDRSDIQSAVCAPLTDDEQILGVLNVSTAAGERSLTEADLETLVAVARRIAPVLSRLLEIQEVLDRSLVEDFERELEHLAQLQSPIESSLAVIRDLLEDLSGADTAELILLTEDGPAVAVLAAREKGGEPVFRRDRDPAKGILGQVLLGASPVVLEERTRAAGSSESRRQLTLYVPLGRREPFAVCVFRFEALRSLSPFQRNLERLRDILVPRLSDLIGRHHAGQSARRLRTLAEGLAELPRRDLEQRRSHLLALLMEVTRAQAVAMWEGEEEEPVAEMRRGPGPRPRQFWTLLHQRALDAGSSRLRELDEEGAELRSTLLVRHPDGTVLAAINREPEDVLAEVGFRQEDEEAARLILEAAVQNGGEEPTPRPAEQAPAPEATPGAADEPPRPVEAPEAPELEIDLLPEQLLLDGLATELRRAQRYHFGFSLTRFTIEGGEVDAGRLRRLIDETARGTDSIFWRSGQDFLVLAPEESRGQRRLASRFQELLEGALGLSGLPEVELRVRAACYPRDGESVAELLTSVGLPDPSAAAD